MASAVAKLFRYAFLLIFIAAAVITPDPRLHGHGRHLAAPMVAMHAVPEHPDRRGLRTKKSADSEEPEES